MALNLVALTPSAFYRFPPPPRSYRLLPPAAVTTGGGGRVSKSRVQCVTRTLSIPCDDQTIVRRSADYIPPVWEYDYLQSLTSNYVGEIYTRMVANLKEDVRMMLEKAEEPFKKLELIDTMQRLGISYHFETEIKTILDSIYSNNNTICSTSDMGDLHAIALQFRILRQHGYNVPQEVFISFKDESGSFKACLCEDTIALLQLYEASYLLIEGENILEEARDFATKHLKENLKKCKDSNLAMLVSYSLELPLHWRMIRMEVRWFISVYEKTQVPNATLLEFAKLDFNMVQAIHQEDLKHASRWWERNGWGVKLKFVRDRLVESFLWTVGEVFEPQSGYYRRMATRVNALIVAVDDVYDIYGTLDELELFTLAIERWDANAVEELPDYLKICFFGCFNLVNEMAYESLKAHELHILPYLKKAWVDLCKCFIKEARWYYSGHIPTLEEYLDNAWISVGSSVMLVHGYFLSTNSINKEALECIENYQNTDIIKWTSMIVRLVNDLRTSSDEIKRGDNPKTLQIYMHETGRSKEDAKEHVTYLIKEAWKKINEARLGNSNPFERTLIEIATNIARMTHFTYELGDGHGHDVGKHEIKDRVSSLFVEPFPLNR